MSIDWSNWTSAASAVFAAGTSAIALKLSRRSNDLGQTANQTAASANQTAEAVARIERERWHVERTPQFDIRLSQPEGNRIQLHIHLSGPDHLRQLDEIKVQIDGDGMTHEAPPGDHDVTQEDYDNFVWGPYRFTHGADGADVHGKTIAPFQLDVGRGRPFAMERTRPGFWMRGMTPEAWQEKYRDHPVRLILTCRRGDEEWVLARPVDQRPRGNTVAVV